MKKIVIVTRHAGAVEWLRRRGITGEVIAHATPDQVRGAIVYGVLPMSLAALTAQYWAVEYEVRPEDRGADLSDDELEKRGTKLVRYSVTREEVRS